MTKQVGRNLLRQARSTVNRLREQLRETKEEDQQLALAEALEEAANVYHDLSEEISSAYVQRRRS